MNKRQKVKFLTITYGPPFGGPNYEPAEFTLNQRVQLAKWWAALQLPSTRGWKRTIPSSL